MCRNAGTPKKNQHNLSDLIESGQILTSIMSAGRDVWSLRRSCKAQDLDWHQDRREWRSKLLQLDFKLNLYSAIHYSFLSTTNWNYFTFKNQHWRKINWSRLLSIQMQPNENLSETHLVCKAKKSIKKVLVIFIIRKHKFCHLLQVLFGKNWTNKLHCELKCAFLAW